MSQADAFEMTPRRARTVNGARAWPPAAPTDATVTPVARPVAGSRAMPCTPARVTRRPPWRSRPRTRAATRAADPPRGYSSLAGPPGATALWRSANMKTSSAAMVADAGRPERTNASRSSQARSQASVTPAAATRFEKGPVSLPAPRPARRRARGSPAARAVAATPRSARSAAAGRADTPATRGAMTPSSRAHCSAAAGPPWARTIARKAAPSATTGKGEGEEAAPSPRCVTHRSYPTQGTASPRALNTCDRGLVGMEAGGDPPPPPGAADRPAKKEGPASNSKPPTVKPCAAPPGRSCASRTVTDAPYRASSAPAHRPPMPDPMTT